MIVSLPMYDWPETEVYNDQFWTTFRKELLNHCKEIPKQLNRSDYLAQWQRDDVLISQTCGYPLVTELPASTIVVGTPIYDVDYYSNGYYSSVVLVRKNDPRSELPDYKNSALAFNSDNSQSGFNALRSLLIEKELINNNSPNFFKSSIQSNSHRVSIAYVADGNADICALDPVSWALAQRYDAVANEVHVLTQTASSPALPLITSEAAIPREHTKKEWQSLVMDAFNQSIDSDAKQNLFLSGIKFIPKSEYLKLPISHLDMI